MILKAEGITKNYFRKSNGANYFCALQKTDLEIEEGTLTVILGRSGGGKSTLLNILSGILEPTEGRVYYGDTDIYALEDKEQSQFRSKHIGLIPQTQSVLTSLTVYENIMLPAAVGAADGAEEYASQLMETLGLTKLKDADASDLSGGEMRRVSIARALIMKPDIIFADEPTADLDDENTEVVLGLFKKLAESGASVVIVTHETDAAKYADKVYRMNSGKIL